MSDGADVPNRLGRPLLLGDKETEGTFDDIPVMYNKVFRSPNIRGTHQDDHSDLRGANCDDCAVMRDIAFQIRDASINVGFFYSSYCSDSS